ncbi:MAG TPA: hypothetical protein VL974_08855 [Magnetospirillum sp.]|jgi:Flp pilus assembly pilin Flp|nr:hypothetical protein [Magnetospirillum sp.]
MKRSILLVLKCRKGVAALEYAIMAGIMVLGVVAAINTTNLKTHIASIFSGITSAMSDAASGNS